MLVKRRIAFVLASVLPVLSISADSDVVSRHVLVRHGHVSHLFLVSEAGEAMALGFSFPRLGHGTVGRGDNLPYLSPDERSVAFICDRDLWLFDVESQTENRITDLESGVRYQLPFYSPSGSRLAYLDLGGPTKVMVDDRPVFRWAEMLPPDACTWITDEVMAVAAGDTLWVVEVATGAIRGNPVSITRLTDER